MTQVASRSRMFECTLATFAVALLAGCGDKKGSPDLDLVRSGAPPEVTARAAALTAVDSAELAADIGELVTGSFGLSAEGGIPLGLGAMHFEGSRGCSHEVSFGGGKIELEKDCTSPSGRHLHGTLDIALGSECRPFGLSVAYALRIEATPGAGAEVDVRGEVKVGFGHKSLDLSVTLEKSIEHDGHGVHTSVGVCLLLDLHARHLALDGHVSTEVDGMGSRSVTIHDLRKVLCEPLPYTGSVVVNDPRHDIQVTFDRDTPETGAVSVFVDGNTSRTELDIGPAQRRCDAVFGPASLPATIDYVACGGCGQPPAPMTPGNPGPNNPGGAADAGMAVDAGADGGSGLPNGGL